MQRSQIKGGLETIDLESWNELYQLIASDFVSAPTYVFRGQADATWKVESSLDRWERLHTKVEGTLRVPSAMHGKNMHGTRSVPATTPVSREVHLRAFRQAIRAISPVELPKEDDALTWAIAQHHGLRTPLLDWSLSPFVALFFAFEHELIHQDDELLCPQKRAVFALSTSAIAQGQDNHNSHDDQNKKHVQGNGRAMFPRVYSPSGPVSQRLLAQSSLFLMMPEQTDLETFVGQHASQLTRATGGGAKHAVLKKIVMPNDDRRDCLKMLNKMNINRLTLFPDLDGAARYINGLWDLDFDSALGLFEDADYAAAGREKMNDTSRRARNAKQIRSANRK